MLRPHPSPVLGFVFLQAGPIFLPLFQRSPKEQNITKQSRKQQLLPNHLFFSTAIMYPMLDIGAFFLLKLWIAVSASWF